MTDCPRILFITIDYPRDGGSGGQIASWRAIEAYGTFATVDAVALVPPSAEEPKGLRDMTGRFEAVPIEGFHLSTSRAKAAGRLALSQVLRRPYRLTKFDVRRARRLIAQLAAASPYDVVHCDHMSSAPYAPLVPAPTAVLLEHNVEWQLIARMADHASAASRAVLRREAKRTRNSETALIAGFNHTLTLSEVDRQSLVKDVPGLRDRISVWPVPVRRGRPLRPAPTGPFTVLVLGSLRSTGRLHGLLWFMREVWRDLRKAVPEARLEIVGAGPPPSVRKADGQDGVTVRDFAIDLDPLLDSATVCAIPLFVGAGIRIKVLELISQGIPCIGTDVALQGFNELPGTVLANTKEQWLKAFTEAAAAPLVSRKHAHKGATLLHNEHSLDRAARHLQRVVEADTRTTSEEG